MTPNNHRRSQGLKNPPRMQHGFKKVKLNWKRKLPCVYIYSSCLWIANGCYTYSAKLFQAFISPFFLPWIECWISWLIMQSKKTASSSPQIQAVSLLSLILKLTNKQSRKSKLIWFQSEKNDIKSCTSLQPKKRFFHFLE